MGFFDQLKDKTSQLTDKVGATFNDAKNQLGDYRAQAAEAKLPVEGSLARYQVIYLGGFPKKPIKKSNPTSFGLNIMPDSFIFKPELETRTSWYGDELFVIPYDKVVKFEIVKRQVSTTEALLSSNGETRALNS